METVVFLIFAIVVVLLIIVLDIKTQLSILKETGIQTMSAIQISSEDIEQIVNLVLEKLKETQKSDV